MSAEINNREYRQQVLKELISELHDGKSVDEVKEKFAEVFGNVSAEEIAQAEQGLIAGGLPVTEVQRLCDVHASVFKGSIEDIHRIPVSSEVPGHPVDTLKRENRAIEKEIDEVRTQLALLPDPDAKDKVKAGLRRLIEIDRHYLKKENLFFPYMEQYGITAPPKVMWGVDDEIRAQLKAVSAKLDSEELSSLAAEIEAFLDKAGEMIFKEENIMLPMLLENLTQDEWKTVADESVELGYCLIDNVPVWTPVAGNAPEPLAQEPTAVSGTINLPTGVLKVEELSRMLDTLPIDITFVGKDDTVKYFSQGAERVFPRTKAIIGRKVSNCHPPASVHIVEKLVEDFKDGRKDYEDFWINMGEKFILIRYFAVRDEAGEYMGVLEVTQNIRPLQAIEGEKRLVSDEGRFNDEHTLFKKY
ncbi:hypothetical protein EDD76_11046 [Kineothrix alysoides]|uniref:PAC domain-containing protein n=1 Tax=Kineothrix alysoides TaxID=1469948 RepID=A0A4R1QXQ8_9FIRM|nr:DUF438 domain-containing protein [Kineothrix alysoides]TCL56874.1 hypothetical protein EDD76_11046 [Kineothrix alysoides]